MQVPVPLYGGELACAVPNGFDGQENGRFPCVLSPCRRAGRALGEHEPPPDFNNLVSEFGKKIFKKPFAARYAVKGTVMGDAFPETEASADIFFIKRRNDP